MTFVHRTPSPIAAALLSAAALTVTGCSFNSVESPSSPTASSIAGIIHGGPNPVVGATVKLYATQSNGYGGAGLLLATTTTSSNGGFTFNPSTYTCPAGQQAYIASAAGNTGANAVNPNSLMMAAIGPCSLLTPSTYIWIDELSTVAAAYALGNFTTISGTGAAAVVNVSAPANNNATLGSCTGTGAAMTCVAAGLPHAFLNAANLVNSVGTSSAPPNGQAYLTPPSNPSLALTPVALQNLAPLQVINTLGNIVQSCVNSTGGAAGGSGACATLFTNTTPASTYTTTPITPTNTLQALINLAKFPFTGTTNLYNLAQSNGFYQPSLTAAPPDFTLAIMFRSYGSGNNQVGSVYYVTTDINDNVYATALSATSTGSATGTQPYIAHALSSNGIGNWTGPAQLSSNTASLCTAYGGTPITSAPCESATDPIGHLYVGLGSSSFTSGGLFQVASGSGAVTAFTMPGSSSATSPLAMAVDRNNNLFYSTAAASTSNLFEIPAGSTASATPTAVTAGGSAFVGAHTAGSLVFDASGNLFAPIASGSGIGFNFFTNTGTVSAEAFGGAANQCNCLGGTLDKWPTGGMVDGSGNFWMTGQSAVYEIGATSGSTAAANAQGVTGGGSTGVSTVTVGNSATTLRISAMDGAGTIFVPDSSTTGGQNPAPPPAATAPTIILYYTPLGSQAAISGCNTAGATGNATCVTSNGSAPNNSMFYQALNPAIDSTGSMWVSSEGNDAVIQVLGVAAPTWPQASYLHSGVKPQ